MNLEEKRSRANSWLEISMKALRHNVGVFRHRLDAGGSRTLLAAVVKGNAYGHETGLVSPTLLEAGVDWLAVISLSEALDLRRSVGDETPILVLGNVPEDGLEEAVEANLRLTLFDETMLSALVRRSRSAKRPIRLHLEIETGTHRQGLTPEQVQAVVEEIARHRSLVVEGISTHFADIEDTTDHRFAERQLAAFEAVVESLPPEIRRSLIRHTACTAASILFDRTHLDLARVGIGIYGLWPSRETLVSARERAVHSPMLEPVLTWKSRIAQIKDLDVGSYVGYGRTWRASRPTKIAVLPVGYYEGYDRALSAGAHVLIRGFRAPVVGRICMNVTMVDVTDVPGVTREDIVVLLGSSGEERIRAEDLARWAGTIHYEIISRISPTLPRFPSD